MVSAVKQMKSSRLEDYLSVTKARSIVPHFITAASAMFLAVNGVPPIATLFLTLAGGGLVAAASNTLNCYIDRELDGRMSRTQNRPLPSGRMKPSRALAVGLFTGVAGLLILVRFVGLAAAILAAVALVYYVVAYTLWLKRHTRWSVLLGSGVGAFSPVIGWVAVTHRVSSVPFILSAIIVFWTLPHFWSLAVFRQKDYDGVGLRMLPAGGLAAWIIIPSILLVAATILLAPVAKLGPVYSGLASILGIGFLYLAACIHSGYPSRSASWLYSYSIIYIILIFGVMIIDRLLF